MAAYDLEEQEQLSQIKAWWEQYGNLVSGVTLAVALIAAGYQGWHWNQRKQAAEASALYTSVQQAAQAHNGQQAREAAGELISKYSGPVYADLDVKNARTQLAWAAEKASDPALRDLAKLRLAAVLLDDKAYDEALVQLAKPGEGLEARFADLKGDVLVAQGKTAEAKAAYKQALELTDKTDRQDAKALHDLAQAKLDSLGGAN
ncbi:MAG: tetratricopeptide repeat protein [Rhodocyclales bacterium]|nr:tetratricopeptide repeat protein [Rhodocyclales bacterium]